jgi:enamine deaminase RidA (YjgF/YER057c/UK114 family)
MPDFLNPSKSFPICDAVTYTGRICETVLVPIPDHSDSPVPGGITAETHEILRQLDEILAHYNVPRRSVASVRLFLAHVNRDIPAVNEIYKTYFANCSPMRIAVGAELQKGMLIEAHVLIDLGPAQPAPPAK